MKLLYSDLVSGAMYLCPCCSAVNSNEVFSELSAMHSSVTLHIGAKVSRVPPDKVNRLMK
eukprot:CAMPEP_0115357032 /NCGR_PEP_ID=MMETSP0270-20121206/99929_1 /TAXON_ID=71861 /ORGANISM="Scrippsiella trochoidea, Strain CCMP3099" /LENGTH=59 /DNA_ID=CAMNT_0002779457 /DNA_START=147 /DNA_END=326 /DNA_ORIENTATION=+